MHDTQIFHGPELTYAQEKKQRPPSDSHRINIQLKGFHFQLFLRKHTTMLTDITLPLKRFGRLPTLLWNFDECTEDIGLRNQSER
jgi:hypothetical protein